MALSAVEHYRREVITICGELTSKEQETLDSALEQSAELPKKTYEGTGFGITDKEYVFALVEKIRGGGFEKYEEVVRRKLQELGEESLEQIEPHQYHLTPDRIGGLHHFVIKYCASRDAVQLWFGEVSQEEKERFSETIIKEGLPVYDITRWGQKYALPQADQDRLRRFTDLGDY